MIALSAASSTLACTPHWAPWIAVSVLGGLVGATEILGRYRDEPLKCVVSPPGLFYIFLNMWASLSAYCLAKIFGWTIDLGSFPSGDLKAASQEWTLVLVAGLSAMAFFRSSLFIKKIGDKDIGIGPGTVLTTLLEKTDVYVDRLRAQKRVDDANAIMSGLDFTKASAALPPYCLALLQNPSDDMQRSIATSVGLIVTQTIDETVKLRLLGLQLMNLVGVEALKKAVSSLGDAIRKPKALVPGA